MESSDNLNYLFTPIKIGSLEIKNRIVMSGMAVGDASPLGYPTEQTRAYYTARARGGVGLIILGGCVSTQRAWEEAPYGGLYRFDIEEAIPALRELVDAVHAFDAKIFAGTMTSFGRMGSSRRYGVEPVSASAIQMVIPEDAFPDIMTVPGGRVMEMPREITIPEIVALEDEMAKSGSIAQQAGFDGIEIAAHMSYLVASFLSFRTNKRNDIYGGNLENRMRFLLNIVKKVRIAVGPDFPIGVKLICNEHLDGGLTVTDTVEIGKALERAGVNYITLSDGCYENQKLSVPSEDGALLKHGEPQAFKGALNIPLIAPTYHGPVLAADAIAQGFSDMISLGRPLLADPYWVKKTLEGRIDDIILCDRDNYCILRLMMGMRPHCKLNPDMGRESGTYSLPIWQRVRERLLLLGATTPWLARLATSLHIAP